MFKISKCRSIIKEKIQEVKQNAQEHDRIRTQGNCYWREKNIGRDKIS